MTCQPSRPRPIKLKMVTSAGIISINRYTYLFASSAHSRMDRSTEVWRPTTSLIRNGTPNHHTKLQEDALLPSPEINGTALPASKTAHILCCPFCPQPTALLLSHYVILVYMCMQVLQFFSFGGDWSPKPPLQRHPLLRPPQHTHTHTHTHTHAHTHTHTTIHSTGGRFNYFVINQSGL